MSIVLQNYTIIMLSEYLLLVIPSPEIKSKKKRNVPKPKAQFLAAIRARKKSDIPTLRVQVVLIHGFSLRVQVPK